MNQKWNTLKWNATENLIYSIVGEFSYGGVFEPEFRSFDHFVIGLKIAFPILKIHIYTYILKYYYNWFRILWKCNHFGMSNEIAADLKYGKQKQWSLYFTWKCYFHVSHKLLLCIVVRCVIPQSFFWLDAI